VLVIFFDVFSLNVRSFLLPRLFFTCWLLVRLGLIRGIPISWLRLKAFRADRSRAACGDVALYVNKSIESTLVYKSASGSYFEYILVSLRFNDVSILGGSIYNPDRFHFYGVRAFELGRILRYY
jgi:hypothetical protein